MAGSDPGAIPGRPKVLIGSTTEGLRHAQALRKLLEPEIQAQLWNEQGLFLPGEFTLESLETHPREFDGAVVVATADDRVISRGMETAAPRDNLLLEFGIFLMVFGRKRALLVVEDPGTLKLPSDVFGLGIVPFKNTEPPRRGLTSAATKIKSAARRWRLHPFEDDMVNRCERILQIAVSEIQERTGITSELGLHVFLVDARTTPNRLVRIARRRSSPKAPRNWPPFEMGVGLVGTCWERESSVFVDLTERPYCDATEATWRKLARAERFGMDYEMLVTSRERYKCVGAVPISALDSGFVGCVSFNLGVNARYEPAQLRGASVERVLDICVECVAVVTGH